MAIVCSVTADQVKILPLVHDQRTLLFSMEPKLLSLTKKVAITPFPELFLSSQS